MKRKASNAELISWAKGRGGANAKQAKIRKLERRIPFPALPPGSVLRAGTQGAQVPRGFVGLVASDAKYFDVVSLASGANQTGLVTHLDIIPQGTTVNSREGKSFQIRNIHVQGR